MSSRLCEHPSCNKPANYNYENQPFGLYCDQHKRDNMVSIQIEPFVQESISTPNESEEFWGDDPNILFQSVTLFPVSYMSMNERLNTITRLLIVLSIISFISTQKIHFIFIMAICMLAIYMLHFFQGHEKYRNKELFGGMNDLPTNEDNGIPTKPASTLFSKPTDKNPLSNVLLTDYDYNVDKKPAPPVDGSKDEILESAKKLILNLHPDQPDLANKLFHSMGDNFEFEQSMRPFISQPCTTIPNDQTAFAQYCYGDMISCKQGNQFACARNNGASHYNLY